VITSAPVCFPSDIVCWLGIGETSCHVGGENTRGGLNSWLLYSRARWSVIAKHSGCMCPVALGKPTVGPRLSDVSTARLALLFLNA